MGYNACTHCFEDLDSIFLKTCRKVVYISHCQFLPVDHLVRKKGKHFKGKADHRAKPHNQTEDDILEMVKDMKVVFGKRQSSKPVPKDTQGHTPMWKKKSIFWELPYWHDLEVRHTIDVMHLTKNLYVNLLRFMGVYGKRKDSLEVRQDLQEMKEQGNLHPKKIDDGRQYLSPPSYTQSKEEKESMFECLNSINVSSRFSSNIKRIINVQEKKFLNLKFHDCHVLMT